MQCKDIPDAPILRFLATLPVQRVDPDGHTWMTQWATSTPGYENSVTLAMPDGTPGKMVTSKMRQLIKRGLVQGCTCGCRGDFELTAKGREWLKGGCGEP